MSTEQDPGFEALLEHLNQGRGLDFSSYKRANLIRRVVTRMRVAGVGNFIDYLGYLKVHPEEYNPLFDSVLINVTGFFRDEAAWDYLEAVILPRLLAAKPADGPIRVWSAGCASGEEGYSLAMLFAEAVGPDAFAHRVKIYATDVDEAALTQARRATYTDEDLAPVLAALRQRYFEAAAGRHVVRSDVRRAMVFGRHDLAQDAPISRVDLLVCRNTLMYFNTETQGKILARFHLALNDAGYLFLGKAELILTHTHVFHPVDLKHHLFTKVPAINSRKGKGLPDGADAGTGGVVPGWAPPGDGQASEVSGTPLCANTGTRPGAGPPVDDVTSRHRLLAAPHRTARESETGVGGVQAAPVEWETLNAALQLTNAELETTNAEFESSNEELGSVNEELHSTNGELETLNITLHQRITELSMTNAVLRSILDGLHVGVAVVDRSMNILHWNHEAEDLWGLRADAVRGQPLLSPDLGLPAQQLPVAAFLAGAASREELTVDTTNRGGRSVRCRIACTPFFGPEGDRAGVVLVMVEGK